MDKVYKTYQARNAAKAALVTTISKLARSEV